MDNLTHRFQLLNERNVVVASFPDEGMANVMFLTAPRGYTVRDMEKETIYA